jgi:hypothetical protein
MNSYHEVMQYSLVAYIRNYTNPYTYFIIMKLYDKFKVQLEIIQ